MYMPKLVKLDERECQADSFESGSTKMPRALDVKLDERECQADSFESGSTKMPRALDLTRRALELLRQSGIRGTLKKVTSFVFHGSKAAVCQPEHVSGPVALPVGEEVLSLRPGELVEVKSFEEILATLDREGKLRGLAFLPNMKPFCGKRFRVFKRMETLYQEESGKVRRLKNTVLLSGVQCDGLLMRCDRSCYLYWREAWLRRASKDDVPRQAPTQEKIELVQLQA
jgi:hypothetical protein